MINQWFQKNYSQRQYSINFLCIPVVTIIIFAPLISMTIFESTISSYPYMDHLCTYIFLILCSEYCKDSINSITNEELMQFISTTTRSISITSILTVQSSIFIIHSHNLFNFIIPIYISHYYSLKDEKSKNHYH